MRGFILRFPNGKPKAMTFSYDDGVIEDLRLMELMKKYGIKGTFNYNTCFYEDTDEPAARLKISDIKAVANDTQFEIACHGHMHPYYTFLPQAAATNDIMTNRKKLEHITGKIIRGFAYPSISAFNDISETALKAAGIVYARMATRNNNFYLPENWFRWEPTCHHKDSIKTYEEFSKITNPRSKPLVMYVWGHSFEFERENNWELIEELFEKCHNNPEIWYATNMEIYNYVNAFESLVFSANGKKIYNPTAIDLWGMFNPTKKAGSGKLIKIPAGETVDLK